MVAVLVHGVPDTEAVWDGVRMELGRDDVVAVRLPGFAGAPVPAGFTGAKEDHVRWLVDVLAAHDEPVDLVGHDWGCILAVRVATSRPDLVRTLACGGGPVDETYTWHETARRWQGPAGEDAMARLTHERLTSALVELGLEEAEAEAVAGRVDETTKSTILALYRSGVDVGREWAPRLGAYRGPALVLWGGDDPYAPAEYGERMAGRLGARFVVLDGCHHWWPVARPAEVAAELERLWSSASSARA